MGLSLFFIDYIGVREKKYLSLRKKSTKNYWKIIYQKIESLGCARLWRLRDRDMKMVDLNSNRDDILALVNKFKEEALVPMKVS